jgi:hypothetical protein
MGKRKRTIKQTNKTNKIMTLKNIIEEASNLPLEKIVDNLNPNKLNDEDVDEFIQSIADSHGIPQSFALIGTFLLFLKGACNNSAPSNMSVTLKVSDNEEITLTKYDLEYACHITFHNKFLRRIAQHLAINICQFAEKNHLSGDLAIKLNNIALTKTENPGVLTTKERAWACSFVQEVDNLSTLASPRLTLLLAEDYNKNVANKNITNKKPIKKQKQQNSNEERKWRKNRKELNKPKNEPNNSEKTEVKNEKTEVENGPKKKNINKK